MQNTLNPEHRTANIYYAAYLLTTGVRMVRDEREGNRVYFVFENGPHVQQLKMAFFNRTDGSKVAAHDYADKIQSVKVMTHL